MQYLGHNALGVIAALSALASGCCCWQLCWMALAALLSYMPATNTTNTFCYTHLLLLAPCRGGFRHSQTVLCILHSSLRQSHALCHSQNCTARLHPRWPLRRGLPHSLRLQCSSRPCLWLLLLLWVTPQRPCWPL